MKKNIIICSILVITCTMRLAFHLTVSNEYENSIRSYWDLSERASTITQKKQYMDKFVEALKAADLSGMNGNLMFYNINSDFDQNFIALQSLQKRLADIDTMNENGFAYQTAIQQITEQEQGDAQDMVDTFKDCWYKKYHYSFFRPLAITFGLIEGILLISFGVFFLNKWADS